MDYRSNPVALAWRDTKGAALFFDKVIPAQIVELHRFEKDDPIYFKILQDILPKSLLEPPSTGKVTGLSPAVVKYISHYYVTFPEVLGIDKLPDGETFEDRIRKNQASLVSAFNQYVGASKVENFSIFGDPLLEANNDPDGEPSLVLSNLELVDTTRLSWAHLLEFRKDRDSREKLGRLRRFVCENYSEKSKDFIIDDLGDRIEGYKKLTKFWGFPMRNSLYTIALSGGGAVVVADVLGVALFGAPIGTIVVGTAAAFGSVSLAFEKRRREVKLQASSNPVAYLVEAQNMSKKH